MTKKTHREQAASNIREALLRNGESLKESAITFKKGRGRETHIDMAANVDYDVVVALSQSLSLITADITGDDDVSSKVEHNCKGSRVSLAITIADIAGIEEDNLASLIKSIRTSGKEQQK